MKPRILIGGSIAFVLAAIAIWFCTASPPASTTATTPQQPLSSETQAPTPSPSAVTVPTPPAKGKEQVMSEALATLNQQPIDFYGKVVDQNGAPVAGAKVSGGVMVQTQWMNGTIGNHQTISDAAGLFSFKGLAGRDISIWIEKPGFEFENMKQQTLFKYSLLSPERERHKPNAEAPVTFAMWRKQRAEPLVSGNKFLGIKADGTPFTINLASGRKSEGRFADGDLVVSIVQPAQISDGQKYDWSFTVEAIGGGVVEAADTPYLNEAPADGYNPQISQEVRAADREWSEVARKTFFVKSRDGTQFARVNAEIRSNYQGAAVFSIRYLVNPKPGSRNLEYDPAKQASAR